MSNRKSIRLATANVNVYGYRLLMSGCDLSLMSKNPVMLAMHERGRIIGKWENLRIENDELLGDPIFANTPDGQEWKQLWDDDMVNMASIWIEPQEWSDAPELKLQGQSEVTITKWLVKEGSLVDVGGDKSCLRLVDSNNNEFKLSDFHKSNIPMSKNLIKVLKLADNATQEDIEAAVLKMQGEHTGTVQKLADMTTENTALKTKLADMEKANADKAKAEFTTLLNAPERKLTDAQKQIYLRLFDKDPESATEAVKSFPAVTSLADFTSGPSKTADERKEWSFNDWSKKDPAGLKEMKLSDKPRFIELYKKQFGTEPKL